MSLWTGHGRSGRFFRLPASSRRPAERWNVAAVSAYAIAVARTRNPGTVVRYVPDRRPRRNRATRTTAHVSRASPTSHPRKDEDELSRRCHLQSRSRTSGRTMAHLTRSARTAHKSERPCAVPSVGDCRSRQAPTPTIHQVSGTATLISQ